MKSMIASESEITAIFAIRIYATISKYIVLAGTRLCCIVGFSLFRRQSTFDFDESSASSGIDECCRSSISKSLQRQS
jgi:hypothetical protein